MTLSCHFASNLALRRSRTIILQIAFSMVLISGCDRAESPQPAAVEDPNPAAASMTAVSNDGHYHVDVRPERPPARVGDLHNWRVRIQRADGQPTTLSRLAFTASMPQHGHGLTTAPLATRGFDDGTFRVEGVLFHMSGEWTLRVEFVGSKGPDAAEFSIDVLP